MKLSGAPAAAHMSFTALTTPPLRVATMSGLRVPASIEATADRSSVSRGASSGRPIDITKSRWGRRSQSAAIASMSALRTRRRSPVSGSR